MPTDAVHFISKREKFRENISAHNWNVKIHTLSFSLRCAAIEKIAEI